MTADRLAEIGARAARGAYISAAREDVPFLLGELREQRLAIRALHGIYDAGVRSAAESLGLGMDSDQCIPGCGEDGGLRHLIWHITDQRDKARTDRDTWRDRWQQLMREHEEAVTDRDRLATVVARLREAVDELDRARAAGGIYTYGAIHQALRDALPEEDS